MGDGRRDDFPRSAKSGGGRETERRQKETERRQKGDGSRDESSGSARSPSEDSSEEPLRSSSILLNGHG